MSLKSFLSKKEVNEKFKELIKKPKFEYSKVILAPPITKNYSLIGTAFDYLIRFYVERINKYRFKKGITIAEQSLHEKILGEKYVLAQEIIKNAEKNLSNYLETSALSDELIASAIKLAQLDLVKRIGIIDNNLGVVDKRDIQDLRNLYSLLDNSQWLCKDYCLLNPNFGVTSYLVGGADADIIIDDVLIDIKTVKAAGINRQAFNQLFGYYILNRIEGSYNINYLGIYSARYGELIKFKVSDIVEDNSLSILTHWFEELALKEYGPIYEMAKLKRNTNIKHIMSDI